MRRSMTRERPCRRPAFSSCARRHLRCCRRRCHPIAASAASQAVRAAASRSAPHRVARAGDDGDAVRDGRRAIGWSASAATTAFPPSEPAARARRAARSGRRADPGAEAGSRRSSTARRSSCRQQLDRAGIPIFPYAHRGLPDITETMRALGARIGLRDAGQRCGRSASSSSIAAIRARVAGRPRPRTLLVFGREAGIAARRLRERRLRIPARHAGGRRRQRRARRHQAPVGPDEHGDDPRAGARGRSSSCTTATASKPDRLAPSARWNALGSLPAVRNRRVYLLVGDEFVVPGPRVAAATERLARTLHPEAWAGR